MECYFRSNPSRLKYRKRMLELWNSKGLFFITEQRLVDQANNTCKSVWLTEIELEEIERKIKIDRLIVATGTILILTILHPKRQTLLP